MKSGSLTGCFFLSFQQCRSQAFGNGEGTSAGLPRGTIPVFPDTGALLGPDEVVSALPGPHAHRNERGQGGHFRMSVAVQEPSLELLHRRGSDHLRADYSLRLVPREIHFSES